jgi:hypothetical protein
VRIAIKRRRSSAFGDASAEVRSRAAVIQSPEKVF